MGYNYSTCEQRFNNPFLQSLLAVSPWSIEKQVIWLPHTLAWGKYFHSRRKNKMIETNRIKARPKPSRVNTKSCSSVGSIEAWLLEALGGPTLSTGWLQTMWSLCWADFMACKFLQQIFQSPEVSDLGGSPLNFCFYYHSFTYFPLKGSLLGLPCLSLKSGWKPPWSHNSCILYEVRTSIK